MLKGKLTSARDARKYMSIERTYLSYVRLALYTLSFGVVLRKLETIAVITQKIHVSVLLDIVAKASALGGVLLMLLGILSF